MKTLNAVLVIVLLVVAFGAGIVVDRYVLTPPQAPAPAQVVFATWGADFGQASSAIAANFTRETSIPVLFDYHAGGSSTVIPKISQAWPEVRIDLTTVAPGVAYQLAQQGYLAELKPDEIPVMKDIPNNLFLQYNGKTICAPLYVIPVISVVWRTDLIQGSISKWSDLFKPEFNKKIATSYLPLGTGATLVDTAYNFGGNDSSVDVGFQKLKELAPHIGALWTTEAESVNFLASGQYPIELYMVASNMFQVHKQGLPIAWKATFDDVPTPSFEVAADCVAVVNGPRQAEAKQFLNYYLNAPNNAYLDNIVGLPPVNMKAVASPDIAAWNPTSQQIAQYGKSVDAAARAKNIDAWTTRWDTEIAPLIGTG
jgi:putative spermidine/putrescine transport system substrate-binding protein